MPAEDKLKTDVLIIGTGPAGCTFARLMVPHGLRVMMVDAGPQLSPRPGRNLKNSFVNQRDMGNFSNFIRGLLHPISVPPNFSYAATLDPISYRPKGPSIRSAINPKQDPTRNLDSAAAAYAVGGMSLHWTGAVPRHHPTMERYNGINSEDWEVLYEEAENILNRHTDVFASSVRNTTVKEELQAYYKGRLRDPYDVQDLPMAAERSRINDEIINYTGSDTVLQPILDDANVPKERFEILAEHRVRSLVYKGGRVEHAIVEDLKNWRTIRVYADNFVVAAGTVMSAQLLWNSKIRPPALGRYIIEHPIAYCQIVLSKTIVEKMGADRRFRHKFQSEQMNDPVPIPMHDPPPNIWIPVDEARPWHCQITKDAFHYGDTAPDIDDRLVVDLRWFALIEPHEDNRVTFEEDINNQFGMPQPTFHFGFGEQDAERMHAMFGDMLDAAQSLGGFFPGSEPRFMPWGLCLHIQGACRMGESDDGRSVVDTNSRVWGFDNLYVGGNSVIPTGNACNPTLTNVALAVRAARAIVTARERRVDTRERHA